MAARHHSHRIARLILGAFGLLLAIILVWHLVNVVTADREQDALAPFYDPPVGFESAEPGQILKQEPMGISVPAGGSAVRVLYRSERPDGTPTVSSGMVFLPSGDAPDQSRPVVAWAHGTIGLGDRCAPSRSAQPLADMNWLGGMLEQGWVVAATDYAGLGTAGTSGYLIGGSEARDVLNSVRAARSLSLDAGRSYALFGHSQGGHSVLWATDQAGYAPELTLVATAAGAPAAELPALFNEQYQQGPSWVIGPDIATTWPVFYPDLDVVAALTENGLAHAQEIAEQCAAESGVGALVRSKLKEDFFKVNPLTIPSWRAASQAETPPPATPDIPLFIAQSLSDQIVLPNTTALLNRRFCEAGSDLELLWIDGVTHQKTAITVGPQVTEWLAARFAGEPTAPTCAEPPPLAPAEVPAP